jgi:Proteasome subunit
LYPKPPDEEEDMTLCIAAECNDKSHPAIVLCRDWQAQKGSTTSDDAYKQRDVDECRVLISGSPTRADHLLLACEPAIREFLKKDNPKNTDIDTDKLIQDLRAATKNIRKEYVNSWVAATLNMEFEEFCRVSRAQFHESHYHDIWETIKRYDIGAELLITLFDAEGVSVIIRTDGIGEVHYESDYSVIGTGGDLARTVLCQVDYDPAKMSVGDCIYEVLRAKYSAERSREVGSDTTVLVTSKGKEDRWLSKKGHKYYEKLLVPYKTPKLEFRDDFLELDASPKSETEQETLSLESVELEPPTTEPEHPKGISE